VIAARIDRLEEDAKRVLEVASVIGREISISVLEQVCGSDQAGLSEAVQQLRRSELLYDVPPFEQRLLAFRHPLLQEVAYRSLLHDRRREFHSKVAQAIEALFKDHAEERASLLAYHLEQAGENVKAAQQHMRAAVWIGTNDPSQAFRSWMKVRDLLADQPPSTPIDYLRMMACGQIVNFGWREGISSGDAAVYFEEAKKFALALGDVRANALIHAAYGRILANGGSADEYVQKIREAKAIADEGNAILASIPKSAHVVALDGRGQPWSSEDVAVQLTRWRMLGQDLAFVIGGPDGLAPAVFARAQQRWSLGPATLPHPLVRIVVAEQLYRAVSQLGNHPYHRG